jgi:hypothetical protein
MAIKVNEVLRPRPGLLVIRQTRFEPTLKTLAGSAIMGMVIFFENMTNVTSLMFMEELNWSRESIRASTAHFGSLTGLIYEEI